MANILDLDPTEIPEVREFPEGKYRGNVVDYSIEHDAKGQQFVTFSFRVSEPLSGQDLTGVQTNLRLFSKRIYLTEKSAGYAVKDLKNFGVEMVTPMREWIEAIPGAEVDFVLTVTPGKTDPSKEYRNVTSWSAVA